jgi:hypothetical protein
MKRLAFITDGTGLESQVAMETTKRLAGLSAYWRTDDVVCREFLKFGTGNPADFEAVKLLFPYLRETSVCRTPREWQFVADCQYFAFYAGHDLGCRHPELLESILPGDEVKEAKRRLQILQQCRGEERITRRSLDLAFKAVAESHRPTKAAISWDSTGGFESAHVVCQRCDLGGG